MSAEYRSRSNLLPSSKENAGKTAVMVPFLASSSEKPKPTRNHSSQAARMKDAQQQFRPVNEEQASLQQSNPQQTQYNINPQVGYGRMGAYGGGYPVGLGYGYGYGMMNPYTMGPLYFIQNITYFMMSIGHMFDLVGVSSQALLETLRAFMALLKQIEMKIRTSQFRRWLQRKSKKSKILRFIFVLFSMALSIQLSKWMKVLLIKYLASWISSSSTTTSIIDNKGAAPTPLSQIELKN
jgi:hypothetical protein|eukprot:gene1180-1252_t